MSRLLGYFILILLLVVSCESEEPHYVRYVSEKSGIKLYKNPNVQSEVIATIPYKTKIEVEGNPENREWVKVEFYDNGKEIEGYVRANQLSAIEPRDEELATPTTEVKDTTASATTDTTVAEVRNKEEKKEIKKEEKHKVLTQKKENVQKTTPVVSNISKPKKKEVKNEAPTPKEQKSRLGAEASLLTPKLFTYNKGLKDEEVYSSSLYKWTASVSNFSGVYEGGLASNISKIELTPKGNVLAGKVYYTVEEVSEMTGMIESKSVSTNITINPNTGSVSLSDNKISISKAEFVYWGDKKGLLLKVTKPNTIYILLKKTK